MGNTQQPVSENSEENIIENDIVEKTDMVDNVTLKIPSHINEIKELQTKINAVTDIIQYLTEDGASMGTDPEKFTPEQRAKLYYLRTQSIDNFNKILKIYNERLHTLEN